MFFNKKESIKNIHILSADFAKTTPSNSDDEYIWVDIYKGTDSEMNCMNDFHYELDHIYTIEDEKELTVCGHGFNCCLKLSDVFNYKPFSFVYPNRYFKGSALVLKKDYVNYGGRTNYGNIIDKLVAKSIVLKEEISIKEIYKAFNFICNDYTGFAIGNVKTFSISCENFSFEDFKYCVENKIDCCDFFNTKFIEELSNFDFSESFKTIISERYYTSKRKIMEYKKFINFIQALFEEKVSPDLRIYLILKEMEK